MWNEVAHWAYGLLAAFVGGAAACVGVLIVDPAQFTDWKRLGTVALVSGIITAAAYLVRSPLPEPKWDGVERRNGGTT